MDDVCLGMNPDLAQDYPGNAVGLCDTESGYYGALCSACLPGYKRHGAFACVECSDSQLYSTMGIFFALVVALVFLVKGTLGNARKDNTHSVFSKILMNHL